MKKKQGLKRKKHIPERTCVACRSSRPKRELTRVVRTVEGQVVVDETGKQNGRGAYLCRQQRCWDRAIKRGVLNQALRTTLTPDEVVALQVYAQTLPPVLASSDLETPGAGILIEED
ncbi:MAG: YlxR family protein [Anaerolineae bacterium]|nr:YlxR family protein [Anaerolineae bacterium]